MHIGFLPLTDAAPFVVAEARGLFAAHGIRVELHREIGWATVRDKIVYGELDAAPAPAPVLWSVQLGIGSPAADVLTAFVTNLHGNALTLSRTLWDRGVRDDASFRDFVRERGTGRPTLGIVFPFSSHHLLVRDWLRSAGVDPDEDVRIVVVPPAQMFRNLAAGTLDGFCAGEPWNALAVREGIGWIRTCSAHLQPGHVEKVLMVTRRFAETRAREHTALIAALAEACAWCDEPLNREGVAELMSQARILNLPARVIAPSLLGRFDFTRGHAEFVPDFHVFHRGGANIPTVAKAEAIQRSLVAAGLIPPAPPPGLASRLFREDLHRESVRSHFGSDAA